MVLIPTRPSATDTPVAARFPDENPNQPRIDEIATALIDTTFCVLDLETTGTSAQARITEIGAVKVRGGQVLGEFQTLVNPGVRIPAYITAMTGISNAAVSRAPHLRAVLPSLIEFCRGCVMVAHNASFDMGFILRACADLQYEWPANPVLDTVRLARRIIPRSEVVNYRLGTLAEFFATDVEPSHRALDDARATVEVLHGLIARVGNQGVYTYEDLLGFTHTISKARRSKRVWAETLPEGPGVYCFVRDGERGRQHLYVGTSKHLRRRVASYFTAAETRPRMEEMVALSTGVETIECHTALEAAVVELRLIMAHHPGYNRRSKHPRQTWVKLTKESFPRFSIVRRQLNDQASYCGPFSGRGPAEQAIAALTTAFPLRTCTDRLSPTLRRDPCALAELAACPAPCSGENQPAYAQLTEQVRRCLAGDVRPVRQACLDVITELSAQYRYEEAAEVLERLRAFEHGLRRAWRLTSLASCPQIIAARRVGDCWEIHLFRYAQLAGAAVARPGDDPLRVALELVPLAMTVKPEIPGTPGGSIEEAELIATWMEQPGVRLIDIDGVWGWPIHTH